MNSLLNSFIKSIGITNTQLITEQTQKFDSIKVIHVRCWKSLR